MAALVYSPGYDIGFLGFERLHPFDSHKYRRAWKVITAPGGAISCDQLLVDRQASRDEMLLAHTSEYLERIRDSRTLAKALELPFLALLPRWLLDWRVVRPMRLAVRGTVLAARAALDTGLAVNLSGGFHHAKPDHGEGFCLFSDIAIAVRSLRREGRLAETDRVAYVDLDAHQGNGVSHQFAQDDRVFLFDMYNPMIYPQSDWKARERIDCDVPVPPGCCDVQYLAKLHSRLPGFLDSVGRSQRIGLGIYNAGTDVLTGDPLGGLALSAACIRQRDLYTIEQFRVRNIPVVMLPSGGYTRESYRLMAASVLAMFGGG